MVFNQLRDLAKSLDVAVVMVTHNELAAQFASRAIHLNDGRIEEVTVGGSK